LPAIYELDGEYLETRRSAHKDEAKRKDDEYSFCNDSETKETPLPSVPEPVKSTVKKSAREKR